MSGARETIRGEVLETRICGNEFWGITKIRRSSGPRVSVVGKILGYQPGDTIEVDGIWDHHPRWGKQFKALEVRTVSPMDASGVCAWLASYVPHVGRARAVELVDRFGVPGIWEVIEHAPEKLLEVKGLTEDRVEAIVKAYREHRLERDRMVRFKGWGLTDAQIARVLASWGDEAEEKLTEDPYQLIALHGVGFRTADAIALRMRVPRTSEGRIRAGAAYVLEQAAISGHVYMPGGKLVAMTAKLLEVTEGDVAPVVADMDTAVRREQAVYLRRFDRAEDEVARAVARMVGMSVRASAPGEERGAA